MPILTKSITLAVLASVSVLAVHGVSDNNKETPKAARNTPSVAQAMPQEIVDEVLEYLESKRGPIPSQNAYKEVEIRKTPCHLRTFNGVPAAKRKELRVATVRGIELVFDPSGEGILNQFDGTTPGVDDFKEITLIADRVIIRDRWHLPGANLIIKARQLVFEGDAARIDTTPTAFKTAAANYRDKKGKNLAPGQPGHHGQKAGDIQLHVLETMLGEAGVRFVLNGSKGQNGGAGRNGKPGTPSEVDARSYKSHGKTYNNVIHVHFQGIYELDRRIGTVKNRGSKITPTNGEAAIPAGQPGNGGDGGVLYVEYALEREDAIEQRPGQPGARMGGYRGGKSGAPHGKWYWLKDDGFNVWHSKKGTTVNGKNVGGKRGKAGAPGQVAGLEAPQAWPQRSVVEDQLGFIRDAYLNGHVKLAREAATAYLESAQQHEDLLGLLDEDPRLRLAHDGIITLARRLMYGLDYFGNPQGWAPMLSLETLFQTYEARIDNSVQLLFLTYWLENHWDQKEVKRASLQDLIAAKHDEADYYVEAHDRAKSLLRFLAKDLAEIEAAQRDTLTELESVERKLSERYRDKQEMLDVVRNAVSALRSTAELVAFSGGGAKAIVVAGAANFVESTIAEKEAAGSNTAVSDGLKQLDTADELATAHQRLEELSVDGVEDTKAFKEDLLKIATLLQESLEQQLLRDARGEYPSVREGNLDKLKSENPEFRKVLARCVKLTTQMQVFAYKAAQTHAMVEGCVTALHETEVTVSQLQSSLNTTTIDEPTRAAIHTVRARAEERLTECKYHLVKAYEYRMLQPCPVGFQSNRLFTQIERIAKEAKGNDLNAGFYRSLTSIYKEDLERIKHRITKEFVDHRGEAILTDERLTLTSEELRTLNETGSVEIDLGPRVLFPTENGCRIEAVAVDTDNTRIQSNQANSSRVGTEIFINTADWSKFRWLDRTYVFQHGINADVKAGGWGFRWRGDRPNEFRAMRIGNDSSDLINAVGDTKQLDRIQFRPGVRTVLTINKTDRAPRQPANISELSLVIHFSKYQAVNS